LQLFFTVVVKTLISRFRRRKTLKIQHSILPRCSTFGY